MNFVEARVDYFLALRSADLPPAEARKIMQALATLLFEELMGLGLGPREVVTACTPRRIALFLRGLPPREADGEETLVGPSLDQAHGPKGYPTRKLRSFAKQAGASLRDLREVQTPKGPHLGLRRATKGRSTDEVLRLILPRLLGSLPWKAAMSWGAEGTWGRPIRDIVSIYGGKALAFDFRGLRAGRSTQGHPLHSPEPFEVDSYETYAEALASRGIELGFEARRRTLAEALEQWARSEEGELEGGNRLLERVAGRCEIPTLLIGTLSKTLHSLPGELAIATLAKFLEAFALSRDGRILPRFAVVVDHPGEPGESMVRGFELAAEGHLLDAVFHLQLDRRRPLAEQRKRLRTLGLHPELGSQWAKSQRLGKLTRLICEELGWESSIEAAAEAATLSKTDLALATVRGIPALSGTLGGILAREEGFGEAVWQAIYDHPLPRRPSDPIPRGTVGQVLSVADRLDTLVGMFGIGAVPSGRRDPEGLRRLAQGLVRLLIETEMGLDLDLVAAQALLLYADPSTVPAGEEAIVFEAGAEKLLGDLRLFLFKRVRTYLGQIGFAFDEIEAALAAGTNSLPDLAARVDALHRVRREAGFSALITASKRIDQMLLDSPEHEFRPSLAKLELELDLGRQVEGTRQAVGRFLEQGHYVEALRRMIPLADVLDRFLVEVLVMDEDSQRRANRLALLQSARRVFWRIGRLKELSTEKTED